MGGRHVGPILGWGAQTKTRLHAVAQAQRIWYSGDLLGIRNEIAQKVIVGAMSPVSAKPVRGFLIARGLSVVADG